MTDYAPDEIETGLWLSRAPTAPEDFHILADLGVQDIITVQTEAEARFGGLRPETAFMLAATVGIAIHRVPIEDFNRGDLLSKGPSVVRLLGRLRGRGRGVLVHCAVGINRSPTIVAAWLSVSKDITPTQACDDVRRVRPAASPEVGNVTNIASKSRD